MSSVAVLHILNYLMSSIISSITYFFLNNRLFSCARHCSTATPDVHSTIHRLRTVVHAVTPTRVLPAPHGNTITPDMIFKILLLFDRYQSHLIEHDHCQTFSLVIFLDTDVALSSALDQLANREYFYHCENRTRLILSFS